MLYDVELAILTAYIRYICMTRRRSRPFVHRVALSLALTQGSFDVQAHKHGAAHIHYPIIKLTVIDLPIRHEFTIGILHHSLDLGVILNSTLVMRWPPTHDQACKLLPYFLRRAA